MCVQPQNTCWYGYVETLHFFWLQLSLGSFFKCMLLECCTYALVRLSHKYD